MSWLIFFNILLLAMLIKKEIEIKRLENIIEDLDKWLILLREKDIKIKPIDVRKKLIKLRWR